MARIANAKNIIVGAGALYFGPSGIENNRIVPTDEKKGLIDPTNVAATANGNGNWEYAGYTTEGVTLNFEPDYGEIQVDQLLDVARLFKQNQRVTLQTSMAEATLENLFVTIGAQPGDHVLGTNTAHNEGSGPDNAYEAAGTGSLDDAGQDSAANLAALDDPVSDPAAGTPEANTAAQVNAILELNGGALGITPLERSIAVVGVGPESLKATAGSTEKVERIYMGYRAISVESVSNAIRRDEGTFFAANFRLMPSSDNASSDGNAAYGRIIDRVYDPDAV